MHNGPVAALDGGMFDALTMATGILVLLIKIWLRGLSTNSVLDLLNGAVVFPFAALLFLPIAQMIAPWASYGPVNAFIAMLKTTNTFSIALAGGVGLVFVLVELAKPNVPGPTHGASGGPSAGSNPHKAGKRK